MAVFSNIICLKCENFCYARICLKLIEFVYCVSFFFAVVWTLPASSDERLSARSPSVCTVDRWQQRRCCCFSAARAAAAGIDRRRLNTAASEQRQCCDPTRINADLFYLAYIRIYLSAFGCVMQQQESPTTIFSLVLKSVTITGLFKRHCS